MQLYNIAEWVDTESNPQQRQFREAVHVILLAISGLTNFKSQMLMKGGVLLSLRYNSTRYTRDIDFSTGTKSSEFNLDKFIFELNEKLVSASEKLNYGLSCRIQSHKMKPPSPQASFPTLKLKVGHAYKHDTRMYKRLNEKASIHVVAIDYSFNEISHETEIIKLDDGCEILAYSFTDLIAEKYRAVIQQEIRNRVRRQDIYDLNILLQKFYDIDENERLKILKSFIAKSESREIVVNKYMLRSDEIINRSKKQYNQLSSEIVGELPPFEPTYTFVREFFESLPWAS